MKNDPQPPRSGLTFAELGALICAVGALVGLGIALLRFLRDWLGQALQPIGRYLLLVLFLCAPFLVGVVICGWLIRRGRKS